MTQLEGFVVFREESKDIDGEINIRMRTSSQTME